MRSANKTSPGESLKILLAEGSSLSARHTLYALGRKHVIDVMDPARLCQARFSSLVRTCVRCPSFASDPKGYLEFLVERLDAERYDVLLPTHDQVFLLARYREALSARVGLALPDFATLARLQCKAEFLHVLDEVGLEYPRTVIVSTVDELERAADFPCYVKLPISTAGEGVKFVRDRAELARVASDLDKMGQMNGQGKILVQQPARGVQATVQAVFQHGRLVGAHTFAATSTGVGGMSTSRVGVSRPDVIEHARKLGAYLHWHGAMFLDYFYDEATHRAEYLEANPRIGETVNAMLSGVNLCELLVQVSAGRVVEAVRPGEAGVRTHSGFMILMTRALAGSSRRQLWSERRLQRRRQGIYQQSQDELTRPREDPLSLIPAAAVTLQLLASPCTAQGIVNRTVRNYSLPDSAVERIKQLPEDLLSRP